MQSRGIPREVIELDSDSDGGFYDLLVPEPFDAAIRGTSPNNGVARGPPSLHDARTFESCLTRIQELFPDISSSHVRQLYDTRMEIPLAQYDDVGHELIMQLLDAGEYPKERDRLNDLKRKRPSEDSDAEEIEKWTAPNREVQSFEYLQEASYVLLGEFVDIPKRFIDLKLKETGNFYAAYQALETANSTYNDIAEKPFQRLKKSRGKSSIQNIGSEEAGEGSNGYGVAELKREIHTARKKKKKEEARRQLQQDLIAAEAAIDQEYRDNGDVMDCQCCYDGIPLHRTTHCDGDEPHFFCLECARRNADIEIGKGNYILECLAGCKALFSREQKERFLTPVTLQKLDRIQQHKEIEGAEVVGLVHCPFCDYAAEVPPVEVDKEFRCNVPACSRISCRLCNKDTHIPLTCEQARKENGISERHILEEAMSQALIKACPRCAKQIVKEDGCNKVRCPCGCILCDCCGKNITSQGYNHFDSNGNPAGGRPSIGPNQKKCPVFDDTYMRRESEIKKAEQEALEALKMKNPGLNEEDLKIKFSEAIRSPPRPHVHHGVVIGHGIPPRLGNAVIRAVPQGDPANAAIGVFERAQLRLRDMEMIMQQRQAHLAAFQRHDVERRRGQAARVNAPVLNNAQPQPWPDPLMPMGGHADHFRLPAFGHEADAAVAADLVDLRPNYLPARWPDPMPRHMNPIGNYAMPYNPLPANNLNQVAPPPDPMFGGNLEFGANPFQ